jgi:hypothetical protein
VGPVQDIQNGSQAHPIFLGDADKGLGRVSCQDDVNLLFAQTIVKLEANFSAVVGSQFVGGDEQINVASPSPVVGTGTEQVDVRCLVNTADGFPNGYDFLFRQSHIMVTFTGSCLLSVFLISSSHGGAAR